MDSAVGSHSLPKGAEISVDHVHALARLPRRQCRYLGKAGDRDYQRLILQRCCVSRVQLSKFQSQCFEIVKAEENFWSVSKEIVKKKNNNAESC